jgi:hypothetical protein
MAACDIINALIILNRATIREVLDHVDIRLEPGEETTTGKLDLLNLVECAVEDMGIEYFVAKCDGSLLRRLASWFGVSPSRKCIADQIRCRTLTAFLQQSDIGIYSPSTT